ncbi:hypothetical protein ACFYW1_04170 [Streptomyces sp. NPDC002669]|uniref:hypothetical protein n=1 Tax=Streptomyces sp. NPDC002669 TaxID=3364658 RepID=UPI00368EB49F
MLGGLRRVPARGAPAGALVGLPVSTRTVTGRARVVLSLERATRPIRDGQRIRVHRTDGYVEILP